MALGARPQTRATECVAWIDLSDELLRVGLGSAPSLRPMGSLNAFVPANPTNGLSTAQSG
jgi:hypothetical protein